MFNFTQRPAVVSTTSNPRFTFTPATVPPPNIFGLNNTPTTITSPFGTTISNTSSKPVVNTNTPGPFQFGPQPAANTNTLGPFQTGSQPAANTNTPGLFQFGPQPAANTNTPGPFKFGPQPAANTNTPGPFKFGPQPAANTNTLGAFQTGPQPAANTNTPGPFQFGPQPAANTNTPGPFQTGPQPAANTNTPGPFQFGPQPAANTNTPFQIGPQSVANTNTPTPFQIRPQAVTNTNTPFQIGPQQVANTNTPFQFGPQPVANTNTPFQIAPQPVANTNTPFQIGPQAVANTNTSTLSQIGPTTVTAASTFNPVLFPYSAGIGAELAMTTSSPTVSSQVPKLEQNTEQTAASIMQQRFLAASLLDPYANRGKKDFTNIGLIQTPVESAVVSTLSATTDTTTASIPVTLPIQSNLHKTSSSRSSVDVNFKLKPVSSLATLNDDIKPTNQRSMVSTGAVKSTLAGNFTDEEELVLLSRTKLSKLRLSNDRIDSSSQSNSIRSLYPVRSLAELEKLTNITPQSLSPTTVNHERTPRPSSDNRDVSSNHRLTRSVSPKQSSSPIIECKLNNNDNQNYRLPILTRDNYYMKPTKSELKSLFNDKGQCILKQFTVGHEQYGSVTFYGQINVTGLNLDEIVEINRHEVIVYPDDNHKPAVGEELNRPARITLIGVYPIDRTTREEITDIERMKATNYNDYLREITKKFDGEFINYELTSGSWTFMVKHFTRYGLDNN